MSEDRSSNIGWFLAGLGIGALVGILYAPKSGRETREALSEGFDEGKDYLTARAREARESAGEWADKGKERAADWVDRGKETVSRHKESIATAIEAGREAYRDATKK